MSDFKTKMHQIRFRLGLRLRARWGSLQRSPGPLTGFGGPTSKEREREGEERGGKGERKGAEGGMGGEGKEREGKGLKPPQSKFSGYVAGYTKNQSITGSLLTSLRPGGRIAVKYSS